MEVSAEMEAAVDEAAEDPEVSRNANFRGCGIHDWGDQKNPHFRHWSR